MKHQSKRKRRSSGHRQTTRPAKKRFLIPRTAEEFFTMPEHDQDLLARVPQAVSEMRDGSSLPQAAKKYGLSRRQIMRFGGKALRKRKNGRYAARSYDRLLRIVVIPTSDGLLEVETMDSREASRAGRSSAAVERYLQTGDDSALRSLHRQYVTDANGKKIPLLTDLRQLDRLGSAGELSFESFYARSA